MKQIIAITGATGFIARELQQHYSDKFEFILISRKSKQSDNIYSWDELNANPMLLAKASSVIHLSGANIGEQGWSNKRKQELLASRIDTTGQLINILNQLPHKPDLLCASAVGIYPTDGQVYDEYASLDYKHYANFSEMITKKWESATKDYTGRVVNMRFGVVLSSHGGALNKILLPFKLGIGSGIGNGSWPFSWVSITDLCNAILYLIENKDISGVINLVAPQIINYRQLIQSISKVYKRRCWFNLPASAIKLLFGQMGEELLLAGQKVEPKVLQEHNFRFTHPDIESCLTAIKLGKI
jgi:uncharacterized protein (TIGR01777 family)